MQRILSSFTLVLYVVLTVGLSVRTHYCMGREVGHSFLPLLDSAGCKAPCCQDSVENVRLDQAHLTTGESISLASPAMPTVWEPLIAPEITQPSIGAYRGYRRFSLLPPVPPPVPRYVRFLSLIFYA